MQEKNKWFVAFETVAQANKFQTEINRVSILANIQRFEELFEPSFLIRQRL